MKLKDIVIGAHYLTRIGESFARVIVVGRCEDTSGRARFVVRRPGESKPLPKSRTAAALRPAPTVRFPASHGTADLPSTEESIANLESDKARFAASNRSEPLVSR